MTEDYSNKTNEELEAIVMDIEGKYKKLYSVAEKIAREMDSLSETYKAVNEEIKSRG